MAEYVKLADGQIVDIEGATPEQLQKLAQIKGTAPNNNVRGSYRSLAMGQSFGFLPQLDAFIRAGVLDPLTGQAGDSTFRDRYAQEREFFNQEQQQFIQENPGLNTTLNIMGGLNSGIATGGLPGFNATRMLPGAAVGAVEGGVTAANFARVEGNDPFAEGLKGTLFGTALGGMTPAISRWIQNLYRNMKKPTRTVISGTSRGDNNIISTESVNNFDPDDIVQAAEAGLPNQVVERNMQKAVDLGLEPFEGARGGPQQDLLEGMIRDPVFNGEMVARANRNQMRANAIAAHQLGLDPRITNIGREELGVARREISRLYDAALDSGGTFNVDPADVQLLDDLYDELITNKAPIAANAKRYLRDNLLPRLRSGVDLSVEDFQTMRSTLGELAQKEGREGNSTAFHLMRDATDVLMNAIENSDSVADEGLAALTEANRRWSNFLRLETAFDPDGNLSVQRLGSNLKRQDGRRFRTAQTNGPLEMLVDAGNVTGLTGGLNRYTNSGTARFQAAQDMLSPQGIPDRIYQRTVGNSVGEFVMDHPAFASIFAGNAPGVTAGQVGPTTAPLLGLLEDALYDNNSQ